MAIVEHPPYRPITDDPDDYRPNSEYILLSDVASDPNRVEDLVAIIERLAPGDRVPLHVHPVSELVTIQRGEVAFTLGDDERSIAGPASVFVPASAPHGYTNVGTETVELQAVFPSSQIAIEYLERNPAPGTESDLPASYVYDVFEGTFTVVPRGSAGLTGVGQDP